MPTEIANIDHVSGQPDVREVLTAVDDIEAYAMATQVRTPDEYRDAGERLKQVKAAQKRLEDKRTEITGPMNASLRAVQNLFRLPGDRLAQAERLLKAKLAAFSADQERLRREEQAKADAAAQRERDRLDALAKKAEQSGRAAAAERHAERAAATVAPVIQREAPKVDAVVMRDVWKFHVEHPEQVPREYLAVDEVKIGAYVRAMRADAKIPGVRIYSEKQVAAGRGGAK